MKLDLNEADAEALSTALSSHIDELNHELARTDGRQLQHELADVVRRLEAIAARLAAARGAGAAGARAAAPR